MLLSVLYPLYWLILLIPGYLWLNDCASLFKMILLDGFSYLFDSSFLFGVVCLLFMDTLTDYWNYLFWSLLNYFISFILISASSIFPKLYMLKILLFLSSYDLISLFSSRSNTILGFTVAATIVDFLLFLSEDFIMESLFICRIGFLILFWIYGIRKPSCSLVMERGLITVEKSSSCLPRFHSGDSCLFLLGNVFFLTEDSAN